MTSWKISDSFFFPLGLRSFSSSKRTVFIAYSFDSIQIFKFKKESSDSGSGTVLSNTLKIQMKCLLDEVIVLEDNTFVRGKHGELFSFVSSKTLKKSKEISGVRCLSAYGKLNISIIRVTEDGEILLEIYYNQELQKSYDISFDPENFLHNSWKDDTFRLLSLEVNEDNQEFLSILLNEVMFPENIVHVFSISNQLFACIEVADGHDIIHLDTAASEISTLEFIHTDQVLLILLKSGVLKTFYQSRLSQILETKSEILRGFVKSFTTSVDAFFYSNDQSINRLTFKYDSKNHLLNITEESKPVRGALALTWVAPNKKIVYLTENNNFFTVKFRKNRMEDTCMSQESQEYIELTQENKEILNNNLCQVELLTNEPERLQKSIALEKSKQNLLETSKKPISAFIEYVQTYKDTLDANITLKTWEGFDSDQWNLLAIFKAGDQNTSKTLKAEKLCFVSFPQDYLHSGLTVNLELIARIDVGDESICVQVPVKKIEVSYLKLFSKNRIGRNNGKILKIMFPTLSSNVFQAIGIDIVENPSQRTCFIDSEVSFEKEDDQITVKSCDPSALYVVKSLVLKCEGSNLPLSSFISQEVKRDLNIAWNLENAKMLYEELRGIKC